MALDHTNPADLIEADDEDMLEFAIFQQVLEYAMPLAPFHPDDVGYLFNMAVNFAYGGYDEDLTERFVLLNLEWDRCEREQYEKNESMQRKKHHESLEKLGKQIKELKAKLKAKS